MSAARARVVALSAALTCVTALVGPAASTASPAGIDDGLWYYTVAGVQAAHQQTTGEGITIAVLDGPVNDQAPDLIGSTLEVRDSFCEPPDGVTPTERSTDADADHATGVLSVLVGTGAGTDGQRGVHGVAPGARVLHYSVQPTGWYKDDPENQPSCSFEGGADGGQVMAASIDDAVAQGADIISISVTAPLSAYEVDAMVRAYAAGTVLVAGVANEGFLAGMSAGNGVVAVDMVDVNVQLDDDPTTTGGLTVVAPGADIRQPSWNGGAWDTYVLGSGTSLATPWVAGVIALAWSQHPEATGNQMLHALIRSTATDSPELAYDPSMGYGPVSVSRLLAADPAQYPDRNPLLRPLDDPDAMPTTEQILAATEPAEPTASPEPTDPAEEPAASGATPDEDPSAPAFPLALVLGVAAAVLAACLVTVVLVRRRTRPDHSSGPGRREP